MAQPARHREIGRETPASGGPKNGSGPSSPCTNDETGSPLGGRPVVGPDDFNACVLHDHLAAVDQSRALIDAVEASFPPVDYRVDWTLEGRKALAAGSRDVIARVLKTLG